MDALALLRLCEASTEFEVSRAYPTATDPGRVVKFRLRVPTKPEYERHFARCSLGESTMQNYLSMRSTILPPFVIGWSGVRMTDLHPDADDDVMPFVAQGTERVLTRFAALADASFSELQDRYNAQQKAADEEKKT